MAREEVDIRVYERGGNCIYLADIDLNHQAQLDTILKTITRIEFDLSANHSIDTMDKIVKIIETAPNLVTFTNYMSMDSMNSLYNTNDAEVFNNLPIIVETKLKIMEALKANKVLRRLSLLDMFFTTEEEVVTLIEMINSKPDLCMLEIGNCIINQIGIENNIIIQRMQVDLMKAITSHPSLMDVMLCFDINKIAAAELGYGLNTNKNIFKLTYVSGYLSYEVINLLKKVVKDSNTIIYSGDMLTNTNDINKKKYTGFANEFLSNLEVQKFNHKQGSFNNDWVRDFTQENSVLRKAAIHMDTTFSKKYFQKLLGGILVKIDIPSTDVDKIKAITNHLSLMKEGNYFSLAGVAKQYTNPGWELIFPYLVKAGIWPKKSDSVKKLIKAKAEAVVSEAEATVSEADAAPKTWFEAISDSAVFCAKALFNLSHYDVDDLILTSEQVEKMLGGATDMCG